jgi:hypothetical protein
MAEFIRCNYKAQHLNNITRLQDNAYNLARLPVCMLVLYNKLRELCCSCTFYDIACNFHKASSMSHEVLSCFRYGDGYTVILRITGVMPDLEPVKTFMETTFLDCVLKVSCRCSNV